MIWDDLLVHENLILTKFESGIIKDVELYVSFCENLKCPAFALNFANLEFCFTYYGYYYTI